MWTYLPSEFYVVYWYEMDEVYFDVIEIVHQPFVWYLQTFAEVADKLWHPDLLVICVYRHLENRKKRMIIHNIYNKKYIQCIILALLRTYLNTSFLKGVAHFADLNTTTNPLNSIMYIAMARFKLDSVFGTRKTVGFVFILKPQLFWFLE